MKRAGIYFFHDQGGVVDRYVPYYIEELRKVVDYIVVVVNGKLMPEGRKRLVNVADDMFVRGNLGFDAWAYKDAIEYIGWDTLYEYDELLLTNSTVFGPMYPFEEVFAKMDEDPCDFWGIYAADEDRTIKTWFDVPLRWGYKPEGVISNFAVYKKQVLHSDEFKQHWDTLPEIRSVYENSVYHEIEITQKLKDAGFMAATVNRVDFERECLTATDCNAYDMLDKFRIPIIRRKEFCNLDGAVGFCTDEPRQIMECIREHTDYHVDLIWENMIRTVNLYDLKKQFDLDEVLPLDNAYQYDNDKKIAVIFYVHHDDKIERYLHNLEAFPEGTDFYITSDSMEKIYRLYAFLSRLKDRYNIEYRVVESRGGDVSAFLVRYRDVVLKGGYDLICFMHDKKEIGNKTGVSRAGRSFLDGYLENVAPNAKYVANVISLFCKHPQLGLAVPLSKNEDHYRKNGGTWGLNYWNTVKLLQELGITVPIEESKPPVSAYGTVFWFRPEALTPLFRRSWCYEDFAGEPMPDDGTISQAVERAYGFIAQSRGFYTSIIMNKHAQGKPKAGTSLKWLLREICPIGLWNLIRRAQCRVMGCEYVQTQSDRGLIKTVVRACMPRFLWNMLSRAKCRSNGSIYVED